MRIKEGEGEKEGEKDKDKEMGKVEVQGEEEAKEEKGEGEEHKKEEGKGEEGEKEKEKETVKEEEREKQEEETEEVEEVEEMEEIEMEEKKESQDNEKEIEEETEKENKQEEKRKMEKKGSVTFFVEESRPSPYSSSNSPPLTSSPAPSSASPFPFSSSTSRDRFGLGSITKLFTGEEGKRDTGERSTGLVGRTGKEKEKEGGWDKRWSATKSLCDKPTRRDSFALQEGRLVGGEEEGVRALKVGWVKKKRVDRTSIQWKERYLVLSTVSLCYYADPKVFFSSIFLLISPLILPLFLSFPSHPFPPELPPWRAPPQRNDCHNGKKWRGGRPLFCF